MQIWKWIKQTKTLSIFPGLECTENVDTYNQGYKRHEATPRVSVHRSHWQILIWWQKEKKKKKILKVGEKSLLISKSREKLIGEPYNYQENGDMGSPLTQERKKEMLDLPGKHSWKAKLRLPNRGDISKCVFLSLHVWKAMLKPSNEFPLKYSSQCLILSKISLKVSLLSPTVQTNKYWSAKTCTESLFGWKFPYWSFICNLISMKAKICLSVI